jgi:hypothetical protein
MAILGNRMVRDEFWTCDQEATMSTTLQQAINAIKRGDKKTGKLLLTKVLRTDSHNEVAWLWMAYVVDSNVQRRECLARVLTINPRNEKAWRGLTQLNHRSPAQASPPASPPPSPDDSVTPAVEPVIVEPQPAELVEISSQAEPAATRSGRFWYGWVILFLLATISIFVGANLMERWNVWSQFAQSGVTTYATIVDSRIDEDGNYYTTYNFGVPMLTGGFEQLEKEEQVSQTFYDHLRPGSLIRVQYLIDQPVVVRIQGRENLGNLIFWTILGLLTATAAGLPVLMGIVSWVSRRWQALFKKKPSQPQIVWEGEGPPPLKQWTGTYTLGQDNYEGYFVIETDEGIFLGEGGMEIFKTIPDTNPKQVVAFDVGIFDKTDITTLSRVVMSEHAYYDETIRAAIDSNPLAEAILAKPGTMFSIESKAMCVKARIEDMEHGNGDNVYFSKLTVNLDIFLKEGVDLEQPMDIPAQFK